MSTSTGDATAPPTDEAIRRTVVEWYRALDRHDDIDDVLPYLVDDGLEMRFPEGVSHGHAGFRTWYDTVTHRFFDEEHTVTSVEIDRGSGPATTVKVLVNWQARIWDPPAPRSAWLGFDAYQTWTVVTGPDGRPRVQVYVVDSLEPMPGSTPL